MTLEPLFQNSSEDITAKTPEGTAVPLRVHDADTVYNRDTGQGYRIPGVNAAEVPKITSIGGFSPGSILGSAQSQAAEDVIKEYNFKNLGNSGKTDYFGSRKLDDLSNDLGTQYGTFALRHGIIQPDQNTSDKAMIDRSFQIMRDAMNTQGTKTPVQKARELVTDALSRGTLITKPMANTIEEYQDYMGQTSNKGIAQQEQQIKDLEQRILSPKISVVQKAEYQNQLQKLKDNYQMNLNAPKDIYMASLEGLHSKASTGTFGEWGRAWDVGLLNVVDSAANISQWAGDLIDSKTLDSYGKNLAKDTARSKRLVDLTVGDKDITGGTLTTLDDVRNDFSKVFRFIGTSTLQYGPQMGAMVAGSLAGGLVGGAAGSTVVPMLMGIGDVYGEMPDNEKDPYMAAAIGVPIGLVDRLGIAKGAIKPAELLTKEGIEKTAIRLASLKGFGTGPEGVAKATELLHKGILELGKDYATVIKSAALDQLKNKQGFLDLIQNITKHAGQEAATEAVQEAIQYAGIRGTTTLDFNWKELYERTRDAAIIGGLLGAEFNLPSGIHDRATFNQQLNIFSGKETKPLTANSRMEQEEIERNKTKLDDIGLAEKLRGHNKGDLKSIDDLILPGTKSASLLERTKGLITEGGMFSQWRDNLIKPFLNYEGGRELGGLIDANSVRGVYSGLSPFKRIHQLTNNVLSLLPTNKEKRELFGTDRPIDVGQVVLQSYNSNTNHKGAQVYRDRLNQLAEGLHNELGKIDVRGETTNWIRNDLNQPDFFLKNQPLDPNLVRTNKDDFVKSVVNNFKSRSIAGTGRIDPTFVRNLADRIADNFTFRELKDLKELGMLDNPVMDKFKSRDLEHNTTRLVEMISRSAVRDTMFGSKGEVLGTAIKKMLDAGQINQQQASELAMEVQEYLKAFDGQLNKVQSPIVKGAMDSLTFTTMLVYMDTSFFANLSEAVYGSLGLSPKQMVKYFGLLSKEFAYDIAAKFTQAGNRLTGGKIPTYSETELSQNQRFLEVTGHAGRSNDIAFNVGANIQSQAKLNLSRLMFKFNLVESATNAIRAARGAMACDEINNLVAMIAESPNENDTTRWARDRLSYYRMDPDRMVDIYKKVGVLNEETIEGLDPNTELFKDLSTQLKYGIINFIDEFSSRPEPGSAGRIFDDHRFDLFTQFKKFTWHFTSNVMPQLWNMYIKRGNPEYTYATFSAMMGAFLVAYAGMYLKEALRGEEDKEDDEKKFNKRMKQAFDYSLGQAPADVYNSIKEATATKPTGELKNNPFKSIVAQSPSLNLAFNTGKDVYNIATKDNDLKNKSNLIRRIPVFGEIPAIRDMYKKE